LIFSQKYLYNPVTASFFIVSVRLVLLLLLLLLLLALRRHRQHHESYAAVGNPDDDVRENIIHYDEEGFGILTYYDTVLLLSLSIINCLPLSVSYC